LLEILKPDFIKDFTIIHFIELLALNLAAFNDRIDLCRLAGPDLGRHRRLFPLARAELLETLQNPELRVDYRGPPGAVSSFLYVGILAHRLTDGRDHKGAVINPSGVLRIGTGIGTDGSTGARQAEHKQKQE